MAILTLSPVDVLTLAVRKALAPAPLPLDHPAWQCDYCDSAWSVELNEPRTFRVVKVCPDCSKHVACECCGERIATVHHHDTIDPDTGYSEGETHLCTFCVREASKPAVANVIDGRGPCACGTDDVFGCTCGEGVRS